MIERGAEITAKIITILASRSPTPYAAIFYNAATLLVGTRRHISRLGFISRPCLTLA